MASGISCDPNSKLDSRVLSTTHFLSFRLNLKTLYKVIALVLLAIWLPVTHHCDLEAAGITVLTHGDHASSACKDVCQGDACHAIEGVSYTKSASTLKVLPPPVIFSVCLLHLLVQPVLVETQSIYSAGDPPAVQVLHRTWQFVRRTALPARAPDFVA